MVQNDKMPSKLTKGSKYRVLSRGDNSTNVVSTGEFQGYVQFGTDSGLCLKIESEEAELNGVLRIIPSMAVLYIDILKSNEEEEIKKKDSPQVSYG
jgi:hypothetical protein